MDLNYQITVNTLNHLYNYAKVSSKFSVLEFEPYWKKRLVEIIHNENSLAAVSIDYQITNRYAYKPTRKTLSKVFSKNKLIEFYAYKETLIKIPSIFSDISKLNTATLKELHKQMLSLDKVQGYRKTKKKLNKYVLVGNMQKSIKVDIETPAKEIEERLEELLNWLVTNVNRVNPIVLCGIFHIKFAEIHPFEDGNGRVARLFVNGLLHLLGENYSVILFEDYFLRNREEYYALIGEAIETKDLTKWLEFYSLAMETSILQPMKILTRLSGGTMNLLDNKFIDLTQREKQVIEIFNKYEQASAAEIGKILNITRQTANTLIKGLLKKDLLETLGRNTSVRYKLKIHSSEDMISIVFD